MPRPVSTSPSLLESRSRAGSPRARLRSRIWSLSAGIDGSSGHGLLCALPGASMDRLGAHHHQRVKRPIGLPCAGPAAQGCSAGDRTRT